MPDQRGAVQKSSGRGRRKLQSTPNPAAASRSQTNTPVQALSHRTPISKADMASSPEYNSTPPFSRPLEVRRRQTNNHEEAAVPSDQPSGELNPQIAVDYEYSGRSVSIRAEATSDWPRLELDEIETDGGRHYCCGDVVRVCSEPTREPLQLIVRIYQPFESREPFFIGLCVRQFPDGKCILVQTRENKAFWLHDIEGPPATIADRSTMVLDRMLCFLGLKERMWMCAVTSWNDLVYRANKIYETHVAKEMQLMNIGVLWGTNDYTYDDDDFVTLPAAKQIHNERERDGEKEYFVEWEDPRIERSWETAWRVGLVGKGRAVMDAWAKERGLRGHTVIELL